MSGLLVRSGKKCVGGRTNMKRVSGCYRHLLEDKIISIEENKGLEKSICRPQILSLFTKSSSNIGFTNGRRRITSKVRPSKSKKWSEGF